MNCKFRYGKGNRCNRETYGKDLCHYHNLILTGKTIPTLWYNVNRAWEKAYKKGKRNVKS